MAEKNFSADVRRHSFKPANKDAESTKYAGLDKEKGVLEARRVGEEMKIVENAPAGSLIFIGGATEAARTVSTAELYGEGLAQAYKENSEVLVLTREKIKSIARDAGGYEKAVDEIAKVVNDNRDKKVVVDFPMFINELSFGRRWGLFEKKSKSYFNYLMKKYDFDEDKAFAEWVETGGLTDEEGLQGPDPDQVADEYLRGLEKLEQFARRYAKNRPITIGAVGHRWELDAFIVKLATGRVSSENFKKICDNKLTAENEGVRLEIKSGEVRVFYRGKDYTRKLKQDAEKKK